MTGLAECHRYSWVVAATGPHAGWPTDYAENQIDSDCLRQIRSGDDDRSMMRRACESGCVSERAIQLQLSEPFFAIRQIGGK